MNITRRILIILSTIFMEDVFSEPPRLFFTHHHHTTSFSLSSSHFSKQTASIADPSTSQNKANVFLSEKRTKQLRKEISYLEKHFAFENGMSSSSTPSRRKLQPRHTLTTQNAENNNGLEFDGVFEDFSHIVCETRCIPRKELYETWATALYIDYAFPMSREYNRFADIACGHGLLSFALMFLNENRSVVCIDKRMPKSATMIKDLFQEKSKLIDVSNWDYVESGLDAVEPQTTQETSQKTILCGVHACGLLTDQIISLAVKSNAPVVLLPCCHTRKSLYDETEKDHLQKEQSENKLDIPKFIDMKRVERLKAAGYEVHQSEIPKEFTPKNKIIIGYPPSKQRADIENIVPRWTKPPSPFSPLIRIPIGSDAISREEVKKLAGKSNAQKRKILNKPKPREMSLSLLFPEEISISTLKIFSSNERKINNNDLSPVQVLTPEVLQDFASRFLLTEPTNLISSEDFKNILVKVEYKDDELFVHSSGRTARKFNFSFDLCLNFKDVDSIPIVPPQITKKQAIVLHKKIKREIPIIFNGYEVR